LFFALHPLRFSFVAREPVYFPPGKSSNVLRGAFGTIFRRIACVPQCPEARTCEQRAGCPYARIFEPSAVGSGPSGLADWPRPFVFRATHLDGLTIPPGSEFHFDLNLFDVRDPATAGYFATAFSQLAQEGLGPNRGRVELTGVRQAAEPLEIDLAAQAEPATRVRVRFLTPIELKSGQQLAERPEFGILAARIRDRISTLRHLYGPGPLDIDFQKFGEQASLVRMTYCEIRHVGVARRSSRTGQIHSIGGFTGEAEYEGALTEFIPYLRAAEWTGVGRQTTWGKGHICIASI
jgi:hypothetical protein